MKEEQLVIEKLVKEDKENIIRWRRRFHQYPELSFEEFDTSDYIASQLTIMGYKVKRNVGGTGVLGVIDTERKGPVIAFRADMDALQMMEETELSFQSKRPGIMHGCGHDAHMAILLGTAHLVMSIKDKLCGTIKFIFQPGEESNGGARCVIEDRVLKNPDVESIFALHIMPDLPVGTIGIKAGHLSATDDEFIINVHGVNAHSSEPQEGVNAIVIASSMVGAIQTIQSCNLSPFDVATLSICKIQGGESRNVIPEYVEMQGMIRCIDKKNKIIIRNKMEKIVAYTAEALGGKAEVEFIEGFPSVNNDSNLTQVVIDAASVALDSDSQIIIIDKPHLGSEDFAYFQEEIPGAMFMLGCGNGQADCGALHTPTLCIDEECLQYGVKIFGNIAYNLCGIKSN